MVIEYICPFKEKEEDDRWSNSCHFDENWVDSFVLNIFYS